MSVSRERNKTQNSEPKTGTPRRPKRRWIMWCRRALLAGFIMIAAVSGWVYFACFADEPTLKDRPPVLDASVVIDAAGVSRLGSAWFARAPGLSRMHLEGDPFTMGYSGAMLAADLFAVQEESLWDTVLEHVPSRVKLCSIGLVVLLNNRTLPDYVSPELQLEILGLSRGAPDPLPTLGPRYHRILNYHAAHDIAHWVWDRPAIGCTAFALSGARTRGGALLVGRNFDFEAGEHFDANKIVYRVVPDRGRKFLSVSWPGMAGAVTGLNDARIYCSVNGARSSDRGRIGTPVSLVVRDVLQHADDFEEAIEIVRRARVFVADAYLIADGKSGRSAVVEKTPDRCIVRAAEGGLLLSSNHFESVDFAGDADRAQGILEGTTSARRHRLAELLSASGANFDPAAAVAILRDRRGELGRTLPMGHRASIDAMIATHSIVCDVSAGILWVSRGPHTLGEYVAWSLDAFETAAAPPIAADPLLADGTYVRLAEARGLVRRDRLLRGRGEATTESREGLKRALELAPDDPVTLAAEAAVREIEGDREGAWSAWSRALETPPAHRAEVEDAEAALRRLRKGGR